MANYRSQWKEIARPYTTQSIGFDRQFYLYREKLSGGIMIVNDRSGGNLRVNKIQASVAYHKTIAKNNLHVGIQPGFVLKTLGNTDTYPNQFNWNTGQFDAGLNNNETGLTYKLNYFDLNLGFGWSRKIRRVEPFVSYAVYHVNFPKETFLGNANVLKPRSVVNAGANWYAAKKITLQPSVFTELTTKASEFIMGTNVAYSLDKDYSLDKSVFAGAYFRKGFQNLTDAAYFVVGMNYKNYYGGLSYDVNISQLKTATSYRGAIELSFIYTGLSTRLIKTQIPCDRY